MRQKSRTITKVAPKLYLIVEKTDTKYYKNAMFDNVYTGTTIYIEWHSFGNVNCQYTSILFKNKIIKDVDKELIKSLVDQIHKNKGRAKPLLKIYKILCDTIGLKCVIEKC